MRVLIFDLLAERSEFGHGGNIEMLKPLTKYFSEIEVILVTPQYEDFSGGIIENLGFEISSKEKQPFWDENLDFIPFFSEYVESVEIKFIRINTPVGNISDLTNWIVKNNISCVFCSGSRRNVSQPELWMNYAKKLIIATINSKRPFLGICFGHQLLSDALGCNVVRSPKRTDAIYNLELTKQGLMDPLFLDLINEDNGPIALYTHQDHVVDLVGKGDYVMELLGSSPHCENAAVRVSYKGDLLNVWGVQFHPEASKKRIQRSFDLGHISLEEKDAFNKEHDGEKILHNFALVVFGDLESSKK